MTFFGGSGELTSAELKAAKKIAEGLAPYGSRVEIRALDDHYMQIALPQDGAQARLLRSDSLTAPRPASGVAMVWMAPAIGTLESTAAKTVILLHEALAGTASAVFDPKVHLDKVIPGQPPSAYAVIMNTRQARHTRDEYMWYYRTHHVPLAVDLDPLFIRYSTHRVLWSSGAFVQDAVTLQEFPNMEDLDRHVAIRIRPVDSAINDLGNFIGQVDYFVGDRSVF
jgi:hypothetical protein